MIYIICYDWPSTSGNHTGMRYLYEYIQKRNPELYKGEENLCAFYGT